MSIMRKVIDRETLAEAMRSDYLVKCNRDHKSWSEIDDGMRDVWRGHAGTALRLLAPTTAEAKP